MSLKMSPPSCLKSLDTFHSSIFIFDGIANLFHRAAEPEDAEEELPKEVEEEPEEEEEYISKPKAEETEAQRKQRELIER